MRLQPELIICNHFITVINSWPRIIDEFYLPVSQLKRFAHQFSPDEITDVLKPVSYCICKDNHRLKLVTGCRTFPSITG